MQSHVKFDAIAQVAPEIDISDDDDEDESTEQWTEEYGEPARSSNPVGVHQTFVRMDEISKQVQRMSVPSLRHLQDFRQKLRDSGIIDPDEQQEILMRYSKNRTESFGAKIEDAKDGESSWEAAEEAFIDDISRSTMEEQFVKSVQPDPETDLHLLKLLGPEIESKMYLNYQCIDEYFRHKNTVIERKIGQKATKLAEQIGCESLKELSAWQGGAEATLKRGSRKALKGTMVGGGLEDSDDDEAPAELPSSAKHVAQGNKGRQMSASIAPPPAGAPGKKPTLRGMKQVLVGVGKFKQIARKSRSSQQQLPQELREGPSEEAGGNRSGTGTPTSLQPGEEPGCEKTRQAAMKAYMQKKGIGRLYKRPENSAAGAKAGEDKESLLSQQKLGGMNSISVKMKQLATKAGSSIEERHEAARASTVPQMALPEIKTTPRGAWESINSDPTLSPPQTAKSPRGAGKSINSDPSLSPPQTAKSSIRVKSPSSPAKLGARPRMSRPRTKAADQL